MTQLYDSSANIIPVTAIALSSFYVVQIKTEEKDGYAALQLGYLRKRFVKKADNTVPEEWLSKKKKYFLHLKEVRINPEDVHTYALGARILPEQMVLEEKQRVSVVGTSKGQGFQGVVKRHGFSGGPKSHGSMFSRIPGSSSNMRTQGEVIKGKKFPGHMGAERVTVRGVSIVKFDKEYQVLFLKGGIPGKKNSLVHIKKQV